VQGLGVGGQKGTGKRGPATQDELSKDYAPSKGNR
jgi:hypothetical protein